VVITTGPDTRFHFVSQFRPTHLVIDPYRTILCRTDLATLSPHLQLGFRKLHPFDLPLWEFLCFTLRILIFQSYALGVLSGSCAGASLAREA